MDAAIRDTVEAHRERLQRRFSFNCGCFGRMLWSVDEELDDAFVESLDEALGASRDELYKEGVALGIEDARAAETPKHDPAYEGPFVGIAMTFWLVEKETEGEDLGGGGGGGGAGGGGGGGDDEALAQTAKLRRLQSRDKRLNAAMERKLTKTATRRAMTGDAMSRGGGGGCLCCRPRVALK